MEAVNLRNSQEVSDDLLDDLDAAVRRLNHAREEVQLARQEVIGLILLAQLEPVLGLANG